MIKTFYLYCKTVKRKVKIAISIPRDYKNNNITYDALFMLDGENIFKDSYATYGRSLRMGKYLSIMSNEFNKHICCIGIYNAGSDEGRTNEYTPFKLEYNKHNYKQDVNVCKNFTYDFINTIIPYIKDNYPINNNYYLMGSSLGALYSLYLCNLYKDLFKGVGLFSLASFLCKNSVTKFLDTNIDKNIRCFMYVGKEEFSDNLYDPKTYYDEALRIYNILKNNGVKIKLSVDVNGKHNEATWEKHIMEFLSFMYNDDIIYSI